MTPVVILAMLVGTVVGAAVTIILGPRCRRWLRARRRSARRHILPPENIRSESATIADLRSCYRLLLGREPDAPGWANWSEAIDRGMPVARLVDGFLASNEFAALRGMDLRARPVQCKGFQVFVYPGDRLHGLAVSGYEPHVSHVIRRLLDAGGRFLDVGANVGYHSMLAASIVGPTGRVIAIEASSRNTALLRQSCAANRFRNVEIIHAAAADRRVTLALTSNLTDSNARVAADPEEEREAVESAEAFPLDDLFPDLERLDLVKIDIEGYEAKALAGMSHMLNRLRPRLVIEVNPTTLALAGDSDPRVVPNFLLQRGYVAQVIEPRSRQLSQPLDANAVIARIHSENATHADVLFTPAEAAA